MKIRLIRKHNIKEAENEYNFSDNKNISDTSLNQAQSDQMNLELDNIQNKTDKQLNNNTANYITSKPVNQNNKPEKIENKDDRFISPNDAFSDNSFINKSDYSEIADQLFNLIDSDKEKENEYFDIVNGNKDEIPSKFGEWLSANVNQSELNDLYDKNQDTAGFIDWISNNKDYIQPPISDINDLKKSDDRQVLTVNMNFDKYKQDIEQEDDKILLGNNIKYEDEDEDEGSDNNEIENNPDNISGSEYDYNKNEFDYEYKDESSDEEGSDDIFIDTAIDIWDKFEEGSDEGSDDEGSDDEGSDDEGSDDEGSDETIHKKRIFLNHHVNKVVEKIDDDETSDRQIHKKYYVLKKKEVKNQQILDKIEDKLDESNISFYDFPNCSIKIYHQNEVVLNRIFKKVGLTVRCIDIRHYTDKWDS